MLKNMTNLTNVSCKSADSNMVIGKNFRITILTEQLLRLEYSEDSLFEDRLTRFAFNRDFPVCEYNVWENDKQIEVHTKYLSLYYDKREFSPNGLWIKVKSDCHGIYSTWHYGDELDENLGGTIRTLDQVDGAVELENGIQSRLQGYSVIDDSDTIVLFDNGWFEAKQNKGIDLYFFGYGTNYSQCLYDYFTLTGKPPLLPRWALGNWWSRFYPYSAEEYCNLMLEFQTKGIPLAVTVIDMDWHVTDVDSKIGKGWTGYTWNNQLFPNPKAFLDNLHEMGMKVTLNLHPAEGIQPHEEKYKEMCKLLSKDPATLQAVNFDFCDKNFVKAYFETIIYPLENQGVDFWWIDWQQGKTSKLKSVDPLWLLNYFHFWDSGKNGNRPITFSRYAGPGSHRYPIGFSGDTIISWESLDFQPYFTSTATNIGYGWWSHDIGGHCAGKYDEELMVRWLQFGVFSPIMRLHSTSNSFNGKEPWNYGKEAEKILIKYMVLRHRLLPYLYTENYNCYNYNTVLCRPMYYEYPQFEESYELKNQYLFGSKLIVSPITSPGFSEIGMGKALVWLPEKQKYYYDFFTGIRYKGGRKVAVFRTIDEMPVFAKAGTIVPLLDKKEAIKNGTSLPQSIELKIFAGDSGEYKLYEDDAESMLYLQREYFVTKYKVVWAEDTVQINIKPQNEKANYLPDKRQYTMSIVGVKDKDMFEIDCNCSGENVSFNKYYEKHNNTMIITLPNLDIESSITLTFKNGLELSENCVHDIIFKILSHAKIEYELKEKIYTIIRTACNKENILSELLTMNLSNELFSSISEILLAD